MTSVARNYDVDDDNNCSDDSDYKLSTSNISSELKSLMYNGSKDDNNYDSTRNTTTTTSNSNTSAEWIAPSKHGLDNSEIILPSYYQSTNKSKYIDIDYIAVIKDDIRNFRKLNRYQIEYIINNIDEDTKTDLLSILLDVNTNLIEMHEINN